MTPTLDPEILAQVQTILRRDLKLRPDDELPEDMRLFGSDIDLDSLDMLLLVTSIERQFGVRISNPKIGKEVFETIGALALYVQEHRNSPGAKPAATAGPADWLARLPHGPEFRFVTQVLDVRPGEMARGLWKLDGSEPFFAGHFPGKPVVPGVLIAEALAQLSGLAGPPDGRSQGKLAQVDLRFEQSAVPPATIELAAKIVSLFGSLQKCDVTAQIGATMLARGSITLHRGDGVA